MDENFVFNILKSMEKNEKKNRSIEDSAKGESFVTTAEKAQYEVFTNGALPRETIEKWVVNDLRSAQSLIYNILKDKECLRVISDHFYKQYKGLHEEKSKEESNATG